MIYCLNCGKGIPDQSKFCTFCGAEIKSVDEKRRDDITDNDNQRTRKADETTADRTTDRDYDNQHENRINYVDNDGVEHVRTTPVSHDHITPTSSHQQNISGAVHKNPDIRNEDLHNREKQSFVPEHSSSVKNHISTRPANEFYKNIGFWGAVLVLIGFFVPYVTTNASFFSVVTDIAPNDPSKFLYLIFPIAAFILIIQAIKPIFPPIVITIFKILPVLMLIVIFIALSKDDFLINASGGEPNSIFQYLSIGFYLTVIGSILMIFFNWQNIRR